MLARNVVIARNMAAIVAPDKPHSAARIIPHAAEAGDRRLASHQRVKDSCTRWWPGGAAPRNYPPVQYRRAREAALHKLLSCPTSWGSARCIARRIESALLAPTANNSRGAQLAPQGLTVAGPRCPTSRRALHPLQRCIQPRRR